MAIQRKAIPTSYQNTTVAKGVNSPSANASNKTPYHIMKTDFANETRQRFQELSGEVNDRNADIEKRDQFIYGNRLEKSIDIPIGHDFTPVNWIRRTVEIHKNMFMGRGFQLISTYDTTDTSSAADDEDRERISIENKKHKEYAEARKNIIDSIITDNGGNDFWATLAENASSIGTAAIKAWYNEKDKKYVLSQVEAVENLYVIWNNDDFRQYDAVAFAYQISKREAIDKYGVGEDVVTSPLGSPLEVVGTVTISKPYTQPMVTVLEVSGKIEGWGSKNGVCKRVPIGSENEINAVFVGNELVKLIDQPKKIPKYYILPNKRQRRRPWGLSDVSDAAININVTYVETLSDWRTVAAKVNFPKYKAFGFSKDTQLPKSEPRKVQMLPLSQDGQDIVKLDQGDSNQIDFRSQMDELKEQFVRETGISRVLFDDPSVTLNSNQALLTSMKPTSDIAEAKKQLWSPTITTIFEDALETIAEYDKDIKELVGEDESYQLKVMWPSIMQKEDPVFQQMLLNRFNANTISLQSYLEAQGETKEEIDKMRAEMEDPLTASILGRIVNVLAQNIVSPPSDEPQVKTNVNLRGDLTPGQEANLATQAGFNDGPFPPSMGPQGTQGQIAQQNFDNQGFLTDDPFKGGQPINRGPDGQPIGPGSGEQQQDTSTGQDVRPQVATQANNQEGAGVTSQPGSGATPTGAQGAINQQNQQQGG